MAHLTRAESSQYRERGYVVPAWRLPMQRIEQMRGALERLMPGTSVFERNLMPASSASGYLVDFSTRPLWLVRGQDRTGRNFI
jgi:hypothetical protein